jgi:hypothetical protein
MADIKAGAKYVLTNSLIGSNNALASTSANDSVVVVPSTSDGSQNWYFLESPVSGYWRLHTEQKGDFAALDVFSYNGRNTIDLHMYSVQANTGQYWHINKQDDGSVKINNQYTGSDIYLDVVKDTLQPTLAARDGPGQRWTLSQVGSSPTATPSFSSTATASVSGKTTTPTATSTLGSETATVSPSGSSSGLSRAAIGGIAAGGAVVAIGLLVGAFLLLRKRRDRSTKDVLMNPPAITSRPLLRVPEAGERRV